VAFWGVTQDTAMAGMVLHITAQVGAVRGMHPKVHTGRTRIEAIMSGIMIMTGGDD